MTEMETASKVSEPKVSEPKVSEPKATEPKVSEPKASKSKAWTRPELPDLAEQLEQAAHRRRRRRDRRRQGWALGCVGVALLPVLAAGGAVVASAARERNAKTRAVAEADRAAEAFVASVAGLDYTQGVPKDSLASAAAAGKVKLSDVRPGPGWSVEVRLRVERGYTSSPVPMHLTAKRCYRLVLGVQGPPPALVGSDC
ncbi:hypothetical protein [Kitasatospora sp. NPDC004289]